MPDPYELNEKKGTRMPDWSRLSRERDVYGEMAWVPNFHVKTSKHNPKLHQAYKEFFDKPRNYHAFYEGTTKQIEQVKESAPPKSVAHSRSRVSMSQQSPFMASFQRTTSTFAGGSSPGGRSSQVTFTSAFN